MYFVRFVLSVFVRFLLSGDFYGLSRSYFLLYFRCVCFSYFACSETAEKKMGVVEWFVSVLFIVSVLYVSVYLR